MNCICSRDLGTVTIEDKGLCESCGRSRWMQAALKQCEETPEEQGIATATKFNSERRKVCPHGRDPCYSRCGVERRGDEWIAISKLRRLQWFSHQMSELHAQNAKRERRG
jgi:hypothetical protein